jgi:hypothetical protein
MNYKSFLIIGSCALILSACDTKEEPQCLDERIVQEIIALKYRSADIKLDNGTIMEVNQAVLKPGDKICKKWKY